MTQTRGMLLREIEYLMSLKTETKSQRTAVIEKMTQEFENDMQLDGIPYTVFADHLTDRTTFIQGLRNAGFEIHDENILVAPSYGPETVMVTFASGVHAKQAMLALHLRDFKGMEGKKMCLTKASPQVAGPDDRSPCAPVPTYVAVVQAMNEAFRERAVALRRAERAAERLAKETKKAENVKRYEEEARQVRKAKEVKKAENVAKHVKEMEEARLAREAKKAANIKMAQEAKLAKDARRAQNIKKAEEAKLKKKARIMAQRNDSAPEEELEDLPDGFKSMEDIEAVAGEEPEVSAWLEAMKQQHRDMEDLKTALLGREVDDSQLADIEGIQWDTVTRVFESGAGESMDGIVAQDRMHSDGGVKMAFE